MPRGRIELRHHDFQFVLRRDRQSLLINHLPRSLANGGRSVLYVSENYERSAPTIGTVCGDSCLRSRPPPVSVWLGACELGDDGAELDCAADAVGGRGRQRRRTPFSGRGSVESVADDACGLDVSAEGTRGIETARFLHGAWALSTTVLWRSNDGPNCSM